MIEKAKAVAQRLRGSVQKLRRTSMPIADVAPMQIEAADTIDALVERLTKVDVEPVRYHWKQQCDSGNGWAWVDVDTSYDPRLDENKELHRDVNFDDANQVRNFVGLLPATALAALQADKEDLGHMLLNARDRANALQAENERLRESLDSPASELAVLRTEIEKLQNEITAQARITDEGV